MSPLTSVPSPEARRFRSRLLVAMMLVVSIVTATVLAIARRSIAADEQRQMSGEFQTALAALHSVHQVRHVALVERCRALARKPRIHAALEDDALDLLYLSASDELRDVLTAPEVSSERAQDFALRAHFYRFLDVQGRVIPPEVSDYAGKLGVLAEGELALPTLPDRPQIGYLARELEPTSLSEVIATSIVSIETGRAIAALVLGFPTVQLDTTQRVAGMVSGIWTGGRLFVSTLPAVDRERLARELADALGAGDAPEGWFESQMHDEPALLFYKHLNPDSSYPSAYEVCLFPLRGMVARQRRLSWQIIGAGAVVILGGFIASRAVSARLAVPVEQLAHDSVDQREKRERAEAALETTHAELQRAARFSSDASHQLKTPVTVLRAGLEEFLAKSSLNPREREEVAALIHQTYRLSSIIEDLLLLSRIDAGRLRIRFEPVDLVRMIEASLDDLEALPDEQQLAVETELPAELRVAGEKRYMALILQNLLENARKYNHPQGRIRVAAREESGYVALTIANTTRHPIPVEAQAHIFERFHRGMMAENIPGYGLGLNLAQELARIHGGDLQLVRSDDVWTEMEVRFRRADAAPPNLDRDAVG